MLNISELPKTLKWRFNDSQDTSLDLKSLVVDFKEKEFFNLYSSIKNFNQKVFWMNKNILDFKLYFLFMNLSLSETIYLCHFIFKTLYKNNSKIN